VKFQYFAFLIPLLALSALAQEPATNARLSELKPDEVLAEDVSSVFRDMGVVRRKAMPKAGRLLISNYGSLDFSDSPFSFYGFHLDVGYALNDFWEIYLTSVPFFVVRERSITGRVNKTLAANRAQTPNGQPFLLDFKYSKPKYQYGGELLWAPAYGKDSLGSRNVIRSDTFFKVGVMNLQYEEGTGLRFHGAVGKTYFATRWLGVRLAASLNYMQQFFNGAKTFSTLGIVEAGLVFYAF
jgi:hypothetical protein